MNYEEVIEKSIRNTWFNEHVAKIQDFDDLQVIEWGRPGSFMYRMTYILSGNNVFISGDVGEAVYELTCKAELNSMKSFNLGYFTEKLRAFGGSLWKFNSEKAQEELLEYWEDNKMGSEEDNQSIYGAILSAINESDSVEEFKAHLMSIYDSTSITSDIIEDVSDFGQVMPPKLIGYWVGLQMIIEQVETKHNSK